MLQEKLSLDKTNWIPVKFGDVVFEPKESVKDPAADGIIHVVGLEHLETENIHLRNSANLEESTTFTKRFAVGDVLFGRRRAYLKKAAQASFSGICSGDITVFRAKENLIPDLLPFIVNNEKFFDYAIKHSAGGLSPRVKFKDLANFEFLLPPKDNQAQIAKLLWTMDEVTERDKTLYMKVDQLFKAKAKYISDIKIHKGEYEKIAKVCLIKDNMRKPINSSERDLMKGSVPYYGANGLVDYLNDFIFDEELVLVAEDGGNFNEFYSKEIAYQVKGKSWVNNHAHVLTVKNKKFPIDWLYYSLVHKNILKYISGTTRLKLNKAELEKIEIWIPNDFKMDILIQEMKSIEIFRITTKSKILSSVALQKSLVNQVF